MIVLSVIAGPWTDAAAQTGWGWRPEERVLITAFHRVGALATDLRRVFAATPHGIEIYDYVARRWELPVTQEDGYPVGEMPTALAYDRFGDALWLGTRTGRLYVYRPGLGRWERYGVLAGGAVRRIGFARDEAALYVETGGGWVRIRRGSRMPERVRPAAVPVEFRGGGGDAADRLARMDPAFQAVRDALTLDAELRRWPLTDVATAAGPGRFWLATDGGNVYRYDSRRMTAEPLRYGLLTRGAGALAMDDGRIWIAGDGRGPRGGVSRADRDLGRWEVFEAAGDGAPRGFVHDIMVTGDGVWFAAADGLYRYTDGTTRPWRRRTALDGLPADRVTALAADGTGVWVGTARGLVRVTGDGQATGATVLGGRWIHDLHRAGDTLWIGSGDGLWALDTGAGSGPRPVGPAPLRAGVYAVHAVDDVVYAATERALYRYDRGAWQGPVRLPELGRIHTLAAGGGALWIGGDAGLMRWEAATGLRTEYRVGRDVPEGPVRALLVDGGHVWAATPAGALRLAWRR